MGFFIICVEKDARQYNYVFAWRMIEGTMWNIDLCYCINLTREPFSIHPDIQLLWMLLSHEHAGSCELTLVSTDTNEPKK